MTSRTFFLFVSPLLLLAAGLGYLASEARARPGPTIYWSDDVVTEMRSLVEQAYVDEVPPEQARGLFFAACKGYLNGLDPYCEFYTPDERRAMEQETQGEFGGVGIIGSATEDGILVRAARRGDPAWTAGIRAGDLLLSIDGASTTVEARRDVLQRLRGEPTTPVRVTWRSPGSAGERSAVVVRSKVKIDSVVGVRMVDAEAGIGYLRIVRFQENTAADLRTALAKLRKDGVRSLVLVRRSDAGGVRPAAVAAGEWFLRGGAVGITGGRNGDDPQAADADPDDMLEEPLVLLVDGTTASAAEILAGALQDHRRAVLVGERTYGKFLVQRIVPIRLQGEEVAVRLTTARYYTPFGRNLQRDDARGVRGGIVPDVPVAADDAQRKAMDAAFEAQMGLDWDALPEGAEPPPDVVLDRALAVLRDGAAAAGR